MTDKRTIGRFANVFAETCESQAAWRQTKAEEYPEEQRNQRSADALSSLADWARGNPAEAETALKELPPEVTNFVEQDGILALGEEAGRLLSRYGFDYAERPPTFLAVLAKAAYQDEEVRHTRRGVRRETVQSG